MRSSMKPKQPSNSEIQKYANQIEKMKHQIFDLNKKVVTLNNTINVQKQELEYKDEVLEEMAKRKEIHKADSEKHRKERDELQQHLTSLQQQQIETIQIETKNLKSEIQQIETELKYFKKRLEDNNISLYKEIVVSAECQIDGIKRTLKGEETKYELIEIETTIVTEQNIMIPMITIDEYDDSLILRSVNFDISELSKKEYIKLPLQGAQLIRGERYHLIIKKLKVSKQTKIDYTFEESNEVEKDDVLYWNKQEIKYQIKPQQQQSVSLETSQQFNKEKLLLENGNIDFNIEGNDEMNQENQLNNENNGEVQYQPIQPIRSYCLPDNNEEIQQVKTVPQV